jgi:hypothetical protein
MGNQRNKIFSIYFDQQAAAISFIAKSGYLAGIFPRSTSPNPAWEVAIRSM